jgi:hypothetical protein
MADVEMEIPLNAREAALIERAGLRVTAVEKRKPSAISNHLRDELIRILTTGDDKNDGAFTIAVATQVEKFVGAAREILMTEKMSENDLGSLLMNRKHPYGSGWSSVVGGGSFPLETGYPLGSVCVNNENFGVQAVRQLVEALGKVNENPAKLVEALAVARENNMPDVAADIEKKLGMTKPHPDVVDPTGDVQ